MTRQQRLVPFDWLWQRMEGAGEGVWHAVEPMNYEPICGQSVPSDEMFSRNERKEGEPTCVDCYKKVNKKSS